MDRTTILHRCPGGLSLPSADPHALAVETMLRMAHMRYTRRDAAIGALRLSTTADEGSSGGSNAAKRTECVGIAKCMEHIAGDIDRQTLIGEQMSTSVCAISLCRRVLLPAFVFIAHYEPSLYASTIAKSVVPKVGTLWERLRGTYREHIIERNAFAYSSETGGRAAALPAKKLSRSGVEHLAVVLAEVSEALKALDSLHSHHGYEGSDSFLGTPQPCSVDAYVYAAASSFLHADFSASPQLSVFQKRMREDCPALLSYVEKTRELYYEEYSGTYNLKPITVTAEQSEEKRLDELYSNGRGRTLFWTCAFAVLYFTVVNADVIEALLEEVGDADDDEQHTEEGN